MNGKERQGCNLLLLAVGFQGRTACKAKAHAWRHSERAYQARSHTICAGGTLDYMAKPQLKMYAA